MISELLVENDALRAENAQLRASNGRLKELYDQLFLELALLKKQIFGKKAESVDEKQAQLAFDLVTDAMLRLAAGDEGAAEDAKGELAKLRDKLKPDDTDKTKKKPGHGRKPLSLTNLPIEDVIIEPTASSMSCKVIDRSPWLCRRPRPPRFPVLFFGE